MSWWILAYVCGIVLLSIVVGFRTRPTKNDLEDDDFWFGIVPVIMFWPAFILAALVGGVAMLVLCPIFWSIHGFVWFGSWIADKLFGLIAKKGTDESSLVDDFLDDIEEEEENEDE